MKFLIITHVNHKLNSGKVSAYAPYVREMNIWLRHIDELIIVAPKTNETKHAIDLDYKYKSIEFNKIPSIQFTDFKKAILSLLRFPVILVTIFKACRKADHIHLRCPGNIGLLGCLVQILFPKKIKTAKYAGNWDPHAKQQLSYKFQKWILSNTFLTKNMQVLVYGNWEKQSKNIKSFFTATFKDEEKEKPDIRNYNETLKFLFVGSLVKGKRPLFAIKVVEALYKKGIQVKFDIYGEGILMKQLKDYVLEYKLCGLINFHGNKEKNVVKDALKTAHFLLLPSKSEGWPKAIAEAMFFGVIPIATSISCVPYMLDFGNRGILIDLNSEKAVNKLLVHLKKEEALIEMSNLASIWSQKYTLDVFEDEIIKLLKN